MGLRLVTPASELLIPLNEVKADLRIDHSENDGDLTRHIKEATEWVEMRLQQKLVEQTWLFVIDMFPDDEIFIPLWPVKSVLIEYDDELGDEVTMDTADYYLDDTSYETWVFPTDTWPATLDAVNSVRMTVVAGYSNTALVPGAIKSAVRLKVQELFDQKDNDMAIHRLLLNHCRLVA